MTIAQRLLGHISGDFTRGTMMSHIFIDDVALDISTWISRDHLAPQSIREAE